MSSLPVKAPTSSAEASRAEGAVGCWPACETCAVLLCMLAGVGQQRTDDLSCTGHRFHEFEILRTHVTGLVLGKAAGRSGFCSSTSAYQFTTHNRALPHNHRLTLSQSR